jgi:hypothetical protein
MPIARGLIEVWQSPTLTESSAKDVPERTGEVLMPGALSPGQQRGLGEAEARQGSSPCALRLRKDIALLADQDQGWTPGLGKEIMPLFQVQPKC